MLRVTSCVAKQGILISFFLTILLSFGTVYAEEYRYNFKDIRELRDEQMKQVSSGRHLKEYDLLAKYLRRTVIEVEDGETDEETHWAVLDYSEEELQELKETFNEEEYLEKAFYLINYERAKAGLEPLKKCRMLKGHSVARAKEQIVLYGHTRPNGGRFCEGAPAGWQRIGENIAAGTPSPEAAVQGWMQSKGHRENILKSCWQEVELAVLYDEASEFKWYWIATFVKN